MTSIFLLVLYDTQGISTSKAVLLHGRIRITVYRAHELANTDTACCWVNEGDLTDSYVTGNIGHDEIFKTSWILNDIHPIWDETFDIHVCHYAER